MKRILLMLSLAVGAICSCSEVYDDTEIAKQIEILEGRAAALKDLCERVNTGIMLVERLSQAKELNCKVVQVTPKVDDNGSVESYSVLLSDGTTVEIVCASDGKNGYVGTPGQDAEVPAVGIVNHDGQDFWALSGELLKDSDGNPVPLYSFAGGEKKDGRTPSLKVEDGKWYYRFDQGEEWMQMNIGVIYGDGNVFSSVAIENGNAVFSLSAGGTISIPMLKKLSLSLGSYEMTITKGGVSELTYTLVADEGTEVSAFVPVGWSASVQQGMVTITAPSDVSAGQSVQVIVFATTPSGESVFQVVNIKVVES